MDANLWQTARKSSIQMISLMHCAQLTYKTNSKNLVSKRMSLTSPAQLKLIVFDLDYTLWPYHVDSTVDLPFHVKNSKILDQSGQEISPFPEVPVVLEYLVQNGHTLAAASRTTKPPGALQLLDLLDWNKYFTFKEIYPGSKITHFERLKLLKDKPSFCLINSLNRFKDTTNLPYTSMLFFDDEHRNLRDVSQLGVKCIYVPNGVNMQLVHDAFQLFKN